MYWKIHLVMGNLELEENALAEIITLQSLYSTYNLQALSFLLSPSSVKG